MPDLTPSELFTSFRNSAKSWEKIKLGLQAVEEFRNVPDKQALLEPTIDYLETERLDRARAWGASILELIRGDRAFECLVGLLNEKDSQKTKRQYLYTRFFALHALNTIAETPANRSKVKKLCQRVWKDKAEDYLVRAEAAALLAHNGEIEPLEYLKTMLSQYDQYWPIIRALRALREVALPELADALLGLMRDKQPNKGDFRWQAIRAAGNFRNNADVLYELGKICREEEFSYLRLEAVKSLGQIGDPSARAYLLTALQDDDAEIRHQAAVAMIRILPLEQAALAIVQAALEPGTDPDRRAYLVEGLRLIDPTRATPTEILSHELTAEDRERAETAEQLLIDLGGWAAVQRLSQRRLTLNRLDGLLSDSEKVIHDTFEGTIRQAHFNFYFAMVVNMIVVAVGLIFVGLAIWQLIENPQNFAS